jgi:TetR/AcrR family transcriptional regulator, transcriptional repressor for nem operon
MMKAKKTRKTPEETRGRILQAAFEEFYLHGFQGGSLNRIVEGAGLTKGAMFHYFEGKSDLGYAVLEEVIRPQMKQRWFDPLTISINPIDDLKQTMQLFAREEIENDRIAHGCPLNNLAQEMAPLDEGFRLRIEKLYVEWRECLEAALERGIKLGKVREDIAPRNVAALIVAALEGMIGTAKNAQSGELLKTAGTAFFGYLDSLKP